MKKILVAFDGTPGAEAALLNMAVGGFPKDCEVRVLAVADVWLPPEGELGRPVPPEGANGSTRDSGEELRQNARAALEEARQVARQGADKLQALSPGWSVGHAAIADSPAWGILEMSRSWNADLIVIGSHGRNPLQKLFLGSVSYKVAAEAPCSVRIYRARRSDRDPALKILVAVDGSTDSDAAVREVLSRQWPAGTEFRLATVIDRKFTTASLNGSSLLPGVNAPTRAEDWVKPILDQKAALFEKNGFPVSQHIANGDPKSVLIRHADDWEADCLFLGARGLQHGNRQYLGTLASAIISRVHCTVEVVRPK